MDSLVLVPGRAQQLPLAALTAGDAVFLLDHQGVSRTLHSVYGHPVTCLDASHSLLAFGVKRSGWMEHDGGNRVGQRSGVLLLLFQPLFLPPPFFSTSSSPCSSYPSSSMGQSELVGLNPMEDTRWVGGFA